MSLFRRRKWTIDDVDSLQLGSDSMRVGIGFLGGDHRRGAFVALFCKLLQDSTSLLQGAQLAGIEAERGVHVTALQGKAAPTLTSLECLRYDGRCTRRAIC